MILTTHKHQHGCRATAVQTTLSLMLPWVVSFATCGQASAAEVKVAGMVDTGLRYASVSSGTGHHSSSIALADGLKDANRIVLLGKETLSPEREVGFFLEAGFSSDTGEMKTANTLFDRAGYLYFKDTNLGQVSAGLLGVTRAGGTPLAYSVTSERISPFGTGWGDLANPIYAMPFHGFSLANALQYDSIKWGPVQGHVTYSFGSSSENGMVEGSASANRYAALALTYDIDRLHLVVMADRMNESSRVSNQKDEVGVLAGGHATLGQQRVFGWGEHFSGADAIMPLPGLSDCTPMRGLDDIDGSSVSVGFDMPLWGGLWRVYGLRMRAKAQDASAEGQRITRTALVTGWDMSLSRRTSLYMAVGRYEDRVRYIDIQGRTYDHPSSIQAVLGLHHNF